MLYMQSIDVQTRSTVDLLSHCTYISRKLGPVCEPCVIIDRFLSLLLYFR